MKKIKRYSILFALTGCVIFFSTGNASAYSQNFVNFGDNVGRLITRLYMSDDVNKVIEKAIKNSKVTDIQKVESLKQKEIAQNNQASKENNTSSKVQAEKVASSESVNDVGKQMQNSSVEQNNGFCFNGYYYPIRWFSGVGHVPADQYIYQWTEVKNHYLVEKNGQAGQTIRQLNVGDEVKVQGIVYRVYHLVTGVANDENAFNYLLNQHADISFQSCDDDSDNSTLTLWFARKIN